MQDVIVRKAPHRQQHMPSTSCARMLHATDGTSRLYFLRVVLCALPAYISTRKRSPDTTGRCIYETRVSALARNTENNLVVLLGPYIRDGATVTSCLLTLCRLTLYKVVETFVEVSAVAVLKTEKATACL